MPFQRPPLVPINTRRPVQTKHITILFEESVTFLSSPAIISNHDNGTIAMSERRATPPADLPARPGADVETHPRVVFAAAAVLFACRCQSTKYGVTFLTSFPNPPTSCPDGLEPLSRKRYPQQCILTVSDVSATRSPSSPPEAGYPQAHV